MTHPLQEGSIAELCFDDKGKPGETRGRKATGLSPFDGVVAGLPNERRRVWVSG